MQNLTIGMWSKRKQTFSSPRVGCYRAMCQQATWRPHGNVSISLIQSNVQDGSVWLMIGKLRLKRQDKVSFAPEAVVCHVRLWNEFGRTT